MQGGAWKKPKPPSILANSLAIFLLLKRLQAAWMKQAPQVLQLCESSARSAKASTSSRALTVRVEEGRFKLGLGIRAQVRSSSPQKSPGRRVMELKKPLRPPLVVELSNRPLITKSISFTGSPSRTINVPCVLRQETRRSQMASRSCASI
ncbi:unnamed protein product [Spirodela intermedia]|uniref:Uncharacterized protein n=1 Tax=Spirodela intermedia TaxID=51605 RepID=A0A7I8IQT3_SPIIN|nr:unnamed protein product [Spirodela intermedia]CAA6659502.1 unnamed protein product [Spirodela intermedia]